MGSLRGHRLAVDDPVLVRIVRDALIHWPAERLTSHSPRQRHQDPKDAAGDHKHLLAEFHRLPNRVPLLGIRRRPARGSPFLPVRAAHNDPRANHPETEAALCFVQLHRADVHDDGVLV